MPIKGISRALKSRTLPTPTVSFFLADLRATRCLLVTGRTEPKFNSLVVQGKTTLQIGFQEIQGNTRQEVGYHVPNFPNVKARNGNIFQNKQSVQQRDRLLQAFGFTHQATFAFFSFCFFKVNIYHPGFKRLSQKTIVCKSEVWWTNGLPDQLNDNSLI